MHIYNSDGRHTWFHLHGASRPARSASEATKYKMKNSLSIVGTRNPQPFDSKSDALPTELAGLGECYPFKSPYHIHVTPDTNVYIIISTRMTKDSVFCLVNVLFCVTYWNIIYKCCTNSKETHKSCACFQHANTANHSSWSGICTLKASTGPMRLFDICEIYIYSNM